MTENRPENTTAEQKQAPAAETKSVIGPGNASKAKFGYWWGTGRRKTSVARVRIRPGSGKLMLGLSLLDKRIEMNDSVADIVYKCTLCGACDANCKVYRDDIDIAEVIEEIRATCVENGQFFAEHQMMIDDLKRENNVFGEQKSDRGNWAQGLDLKDANAQKVDVLFHAGCRFSYDEDLLDVIRGAVTLIRDAGVDLGVAGKGESCCGGRAFGLGCVLVTQNPVDIDYKGIIEIQFIFLSLDENELIRNR